MIILHLAVIYVGSSLYYNCSVWRLPYNEDCQCRNWYVEFHEDYLLSYFLCKFDPQLNQNTQFEITGQKMYFRNSISWKL